MIYILMFSISIILMGLGFKIKNNKIVKFLLISLSLFLPCLLAGLRDLSVGTDTGGYIWNLFVNAKNIKSFGGMISFSNWIYYSKDYLYLFFTYIFARNNLSFQLLLFVYECLIIIPIYFSIKMNEKEKKNIVFGMLLFYLSFYNLSLNMLRQAISISFILLGFSILKNKDGRKKYLLSFVFLLVGYGFHDTAMLALPLYLLYIIFNKENINEKIKKVIFVIIVISSIITVIFYKPLLTFIGSVGIYPKATMYLNRFSEFDFNYLGTLRNLLLLFVIIFNKKEYINQNENHRYAVLLGIVNILISFLGAFVKYADRISLYIFYILLFFYITILSPQKGKNNFYKILIVLFFIIYWFVVIFINNSNQTLPYAFFN